MDSHDEFLRTWYGVLWSNIDRSMTSIWQIAGPIALVGGAFLSIDRLGPHLTASLQLVVLFWALNNTMDMNSWHRRNLIFAARVERHFLNDADYGVIIASSFKEPPTDWIDFYMINFVTFFALIGVTLIVYIVKILHMPQLVPCLILGPAIIFLVGTLATAYTFIRCEKQAERYLRETSGTPQS